MKVLFITERFPYPLDSGGNVRTFHLLGGLAGAHEVSLIATSQHPVDESHRRVVADLCRQVEIVTVPTRGTLREAADFAVSVARRTSYLLMRHRFEAVYQAVANAFNAQSQTGSGRSIFRASRVFDAVHFNHLDAALYQTAVPPGTPCVLDEHNVVSNQVRTTAASEHRLTRRMILAREYRILRRLEADICNRMSLCFTCSDVDARALQMLGVKRPLAVIPNGVDLRYFAPSNRPCTGPPEMIFVGTLDYEPCETGIWFFCKEILPRVHLEMPDARLVVVGRKPSPRLSALARLDARIKLTGHVDDVRPYVESACVCVVPLLSGSGTRLKILEAFAIGTPVVATSIGAEGIDCVSGEHLLIANEPADFAKSVLELLRDPERSERLRVASRRLVEEKYSWEVINRNLLAQYRGLFA